MYDEILNQISEELNLEFSVRMQDWGIINASPTRVGEFIDYFNQKPYLVDMLKYEALELILESYNAAILNNLTDSEIEVKFIDFIKESTSKKGEVDISILNYWRMIKSEEFPIGYFLTQLLGSAE